MYEDAVRLLVTNMGIYYFGVLDYVCNLAELHTLPSDAQTTTYIIVSSSAPLLSKDWQIEIELYTACVVQGPLRSFLLTFAHH